MRIVEKTHNFVIIAGSDEDAHRLRGWATAHADRQFAVVRDDERAVRFTGCDPIHAASMRPINVTSRAATPEIRILSNFAHTPFWMDGRVYASVEAFWQGLKYPDDVERERIASLWGRAARRAGQGAPPMDTCEYRGEQVEIGSPDHWQLMRRACSCKFEQSMPAQRALLSTGSRLLTHRMRSDSRTIPGAVMASLWMEIRQRLAERLVNQGRRAP